MDSELGEAISKVKSVVRVGDGRGFVVEPKLGAVVITAAHCLPSLPPPHSASYLEERTYQALLGPLGAKPTVWAECLFADPVADIAVLGSPDDQALVEQAEAYRALVANVTPLAIGEAPKMGRERVPGHWVSTSDGRRFRTRSFWTTSPGKGTAQLLSLGGKWMTRPVEYHGQLLSVGGKPLDGGMSGSPIVMDGKAVAVVSTDQRNPVLRDCLPAWFLRGTNR